MKKASVAFSGIILTASTLAVAGSADYDYPPGHAELLQLFRPISSEEVQKMVSAEGIGIGENSVGSAILEPILIRCIDGSPSYYWVISHKTNDPKVRRVAENVIAMANAEGGFDPYEFREACEFLLGRRNEFCTFYAEAWTWAGNIGMHSGELNVHIINEFGRYLEIAEEEFGKGNLVKAKLYAAGVLPSSPVIVFETKNGGKKYLYDHDNDVVEVGGEYIWRVDREWWEKAFNNYQNHSAEWDMAKTRWADTLTRIEGHSKKEGGYYRVQITEGSLDTDGRIYNVPEMNMNFRPGSNTCWRFTMASIITFWSQKYQLKLVEGVDIPPPGENTDTTDYGFRVYDAITSWIKATPEWAHYVVFDEGAFPDAAVDMADEYTTFCGYNEDKKNAFYYLCWWLWSGKEKNTTDYIETHLTWAGIVVAITDGLPLYSRWDYHPVKQGPHAVPLIGYNSSSQVITWNMIGNPYDPEILAYPPDYGENHIWGWITEPQKGGNVTPWVSSFLVKRGRSRAELTWRLATARDVKGFNVYREDTCGNLHQINKDIIDHVAGDPFSYKYVDKNYEKGRPFVLELVRYTPDYVKYLIHQREVTR